MFFFFLRGGGGPQNCALCLSLCEHRRWDQWENWLMKSPLRSCRAASTFLKTAATSGRGLAGKCWTGVVKIKAILLHNVCKYCTETVIVLSILRFILLLKYLYIFNLSVFLRLEFEYKIASMQYYLMYAINTLTIFKVCAHFLLSYNYLHPKSEPWTHVFKLFLKG